MHGLLIFLYQHSSGLSCHGSSWHGEVAGLVETAQKTGHFFKKYCMLKAAITVHLSSCECPLFLNFTDLDTPDLVSELTWALKPQRDH